MGTGGQGESAANSHHLAVQGESDVGVVAAAHGLERRERPLVRLILRLGFTFRLKLQALLELGDGWAVERCRWQCAGLQGTTVEAWTVAVEALADDFAATDDD